MFNTLPTRFRHYEVLKLLGRGGFGAVYLARDTKLRRNVVLKTLHVHLAAQPEMVRRFLREARAMARLDHANIVRVNRVDDDPQLPFFEMEYVEGQTLADYRGAKALSLGEAMPLLKQMAAALDVAHQQKIIHRDVKPANVLIKPDGTLKLTDFGIIKLLEATGTLHPSTGGIIGTPAYMAPEQADLSRKHEIGPATDIYALGVLTYELLTAHLPFFGGPAPAILYAHVYTPPPDPRSLNPNMPASVAQVLLKALNKQPTNRYPSAMSFVEALQQAASSKITPPPPPPPPSPPLPTTNAATVPPTAPFITDTDSSAPTSGGASVNIGQPIAQSSQNAWPIIIGLLMACIVGLLLRPFIFPQDAPPAESGVVIATEAPAQPTEVPPTGDTSTFGIGSTIVGQDGMTLLYVPAGEFLRGSKEDDSAADKDEKPPRTIYLDAFWIDQTEVTNQMFARFVEETGHQTDAQKEGISFVCANGSCDNTKGADWQHPQGPDSTIQGLEQHPVVQLNWYDAKAYCEWAGRRLPTEAEWEKAARGGLTTEESRIYPWGNEEVAAKHVNFCDQNCSWSHVDQNINDGYKLTAPVGSYPDGASPYGALDMAGNVWEWTADWYGAAYYHDTPEQNPQGPDTSDSKVLRGGAWRDEAHRIRVGERTNGPPARRGDLDGVRCAASP